MKKILSIALIALLGMSACKKDSEETSTDGGGGTSSDPSTCGTAGEVEQSTNAEIEAMRLAMVSFRSSLSEDLLSQATSCLDDARFYTWHNTPNGNGTQRDGIIYGDLDATQLTSFKNMLQLFLSTDGYKKVSDISELAEGLLSTTNGSVWHPDFYSIDLFGDPENSGSWGFQLDGHHLAINFLVHGDELSIVPAFLGGEPAVSTYNGTDFDIFEQERELGLDVFNGLSTAEQTDAVSVSSHAMEVGPAGTPGDVDPYRGDYDYSVFAGVGLKYSDMSATTQANLELLMKEYVYNMTPNFADLWWADVQANIDDTYFVWVDESGSPNTTAPFYYRIYNPYLWVEYNSENALGGGGADYNHVHTITRIPNIPTKEFGGDYGIFAKVINNGGVKTLYEHYAHADHHQLSKLPFDYKVVHSKPRAHPHPHTHGG